MIILNKRHLMDSLSKLHSKNVTSFIMIKLNKSQELTMDYVSSGYFRFCDRQPMPDVY